MAATALLLHPTTPPTYHRIVSPTLSIPTEPTTTVPVGLLACQRDPLLRSLATTVVSAQPAFAAPAPAGKKAKKGGAAPSRADPLLEVVLQDTVLFPEGGGQPTDFGVINVDEKEWEVVEVKRRGGTAVHYVKIGDTGVKGLVSGSKVTVQLGDAGFRRRLDHMSLHTSQHLLSALLETRLQLPTLSWSLTAWPAPCYVELPRAISLNEIAAIQDEANTLVFEGRAVHVEVEEFDRSSYEGVQVTDIGGKGRAVGKGVPEDYTGGVKRVVVIDGVDRNPCCGTHLPSLHNLQLFLLPQTESLSRAATAGSSSVGTTTTRLSFLCGPRLLAHLGSAHGLLAAAAGTLSCGPAHVPERISQVADERRRAEKRAEALEAEVARSLARDLAAQISDDVGEGGCWKHHLHRTDDTPGAVAFLGSVAAAFVTAVGEQPREYLVVLSSSPSAPASTSTNVVLVVGSDDGRVKAVGEGLKGKLSVKGGGKGTKWSGKHVGVWREAKESVVVDEVLHDA